MSHFTKCKSKIRDLDVLKRVAESKGLKVEKGSTTFNSVYGDTTEAEMIITDNRGGGCAVANAKDGDGYELVIDNYSNSITQVVGQDCDILSRDYMVEIVGDQATAMGGIVTDMETLKDGSIEIHISV